ncbi:MAG: hypothetical protein AAGF68_05470 [Pseudomonadota bacterium]
MRNRDLWRRLEAFEFDAPGGDAPFSLKLAVAENWNDDYTVRVLEEYRRFLYLTQIQSAQVTPSIPVDRAWHMHMTYTRSYWEDLCDGVIGAKIHHNPCESEADMPRYLAQYEATKTLYEREFGAAPPEDIWPGKATDDPLFMVKPGGPLVLLLWLTIPIGIFLTGISATGRLPFSFLVPLGVTLAAVAATIYFAWKAAPKHKRRTKEASESGVWFSFEYGRSGRDRDGDGDGDGGGGCGD